MDPAFGLVALLVIVGVFAHWGIRLDQRRQRLHNAVRQIKRRRRPIQLARFLEDLAAHSWPRSN